MIRRVVISNNPAWSDGILQLFAACGEHPIFGQAVVVPDQFVLRPYRPAGCTCSHEEEEAAWVRTHHHHPNCAITALRSYCAGDIYFDDPLLLRQARKRVCAEFQLDHVRCTCGCDEQLEHWRATHPHTHACIAGPNFFHLPRNYALWWYEEPLRDAWASHPLSDREFFRVLQECLAVLP